MTTANFTLAGHSYAFGVYGAPLMLNRMLAYLEYASAPQYTIYCCTRPFGMSEYVTTVFIPPHPVWPLEERLNFSGHDESYSGAVQAAAINAMCNLCFLYPDLVDSPFGYFVSQESFTQSIYQPETFLEPNDALLETAHMLNITHRLYRSAAYDRDAYRHRLGRALEYLHRYVDPRLLPEGLMAASGDFSRPQHGDRPYVLRFRDIPGPHYSTRYRMATAIPGTLRRRREPHPSETPTIFSRPAPIPSEFELHETLYTNMEEGILEMDDEY